MPAPTSVDLLVTGTIVTVDRSRRIIDDGAVAVADGAIVAVGPRAELEATYRAAEVLGGEGAVVTPGMINAHQHLTGDRLLHSGVPDDLAPGESIFTWVIPSRGEHTPDDDELSATLGLVEALGNGVTTTVEAGTVAHPDRVAAAFAAVGARGTLGCWGWDVEDGPWASPADEVLARQRENVGILASEALVDGWVTLVGHDLMSDALAAGAAELARELGTGLTFHISPTAADADWYLEHTGRRPLEHFRHLEVLGPSTLLAHAVHLDDAEAAAIIETDTAVAYCPWAYLRLGQGVSGAGRHVELRAKGARVALGCDAENAGDAVDILRTAALAAGLAKDMAVDPTVFGAHDALEMATIGGAAAIGRAADLGSLEVGKRADLVVHDTSGPEWIPRSADPVLQLVWAADGRSVTDVVVDGRVVVRDGRVIGVDLGVLAAEAKERSAALLDRAGISPTSRWPGR